MKYLDAQGKSMKTRENLIYGHIRGWLVSNGKNVRWLAHEIGVPYGTCIQVLNSNTKSNPQVREKVVQLMGAAPWKKYPPKDYES